MEIFGQTANNEKMIIRDIIRRLRISSLYFFTMNNDSEIMTRMIIPSPRYANPSYCSKHTGKEGRKEECPIELINELRLHSNSPVPYEAETSP